jgi:hypothetical protein
MALATSNKGSAWTSGRTHRTHPLCKSALIHRAWITTFENAYDLPRRVVSLALIPRDSKTLKGELCLFVDLEVACKLQSAHACQVRCAARCRRCATVRCAAAVRCVPLCCAGHSGAQRAAAGSVLCRCDATSVDAMPGQSMPAGPAASSALCRCRCPESCTIQLYSVRCLCVCVPETRCWALLHGVLG